MTAPSTAVGIAAAVTDLCIQLVVAKFMLMAKPYGSGLLTIPTRFIRQCRARVVQGKGVKAVVGVDSHYAQIGLVTVRLPLQPQSSLLLINVVGVRAT